MNIHDDESRVIGIVGEGVMNNVCDDRARATGRVEEGSIITFTNGYMGPRPVQAQPCGIHLLDLFLGFSEKLLA